MIEIDEKYLEQAKKEYQELMMRLSKSFEYQKQMLQFIEEHAAVSHQLVLYLYNKLGYEWPAHLKNYKFKTKDPRCDFPEEK